MCKLREERFIIKVVEMHFIQGRSQVEIAKKLGVSRTTISRTVAQARQRGYIEFKVNYPADACPRQESLLEEKYNLREAIIAGGKLDTNIHSEVASYVSDYILRIIKSNMTIAISNGRSLNEVDEFMKDDVRLKFLKAKGVEVLPLIPSYNMPANVDEYHRIAYSNRNVSNIAQLLNAHSYHLLLPPLVSSKEMKEELLKEESIRKVLMRIEQADMVAVGIGTLDDSSAGINSGIVSTKEYHHLRKKGGKAEIMMHIIDEHGEVINDAYEDRVTCMPLDKFKKIPIRVGVAYGMEKAEAIRAVLQGHLINVLITDEEVAKYLQDN
ncbi:MAG: sugar-binding domain-containing protein [Anaerostipes sp.]|nr:sugar-binding domain-containing protein [Anaerostipes sp.]